MSLYIGALGLETFDDAIESVSNTLVARIVSDITNTSNYVLTTSNILIGRIVSDINDTSNYVKITSNILEARIKALEGTEGSAGDVNLGIPSIPSTGAIAVAAAIATVTAACISANGITVLTLLDILEDKVDLNKTQADKIGGWSSNYSDKVGIWGSNYVWNTSNILIGRINDTSNYVWNTSNILVGHINDTSNYVWNTSNILAGRIDDTSNYVWNTSNILAGRINDTSNYVWNTSNILIGRINDTSNYVWNTSNILVKRITDEADFTSNYVKITSNILVKRITDEADFTSNYVKITSNILVKRITDEVDFTSNYVLNTSNILVKRITDEGDFTSNYVKITSNILVGSINDTSNYVLSTSNILVKRISDFGTNYWTPSGTNDIYLNQAGSVGIGTNTPQNKLHIYNTTSSTLRLETTTTGTASVIFQRGATNDIRTDYRIINDADILKFQYQDNLINFGATGSDIMWVYDKRTEFIKDGYFKGTMGIGMLPNVNALSITGDTYMDGSLGINTSAGSYPLDVYGDVNIDGDVGIGANPIAGVRLYVSGITRFGGSVGIGVAPTSYALDIIGSARVDGYVGIGTIPSSSTYRLDILGNLRTQGGIVSTGIIQAGNGLTASTGLITASAGISSTTLTASGLITANGGITIPAGQTLTSTGTTILTGNVGIGTTSHATYKVDVNGTLNATTLLMGGNPISGSKWTTATDTTEIYYNAGNVGIGTTDPLCKLQIGIASQVSPTITGTFILGAHGNTFINNALSFGLPYRESGANFPCNKINFYKVAGHGDGIGLSTGGVEYFTGGPYSSGNHIFYTGATDTSFGTERLRINGNGNVVIGTTALDARLSIRGSPGAIGIDLSTDDQYAEMRVIRNSRSIYDRHLYLNYQAGGTSTIFLFSNNANTARAEGGHFYVNNTMQANIVQALGITYWANNVWNSSNEGETRIYFGTSSTTYIRGATTLGRVTAFRNGGQQDIGYFENFYFYCYGPGNLSDRRIKRDIEEINDETALNMILLVQPTTYYYRDEARNKGNGKVYGFIAQQIKEVIPDAVMITKDIIANIYKTCLVYNKREIYHSIPQDVEIDTEVSILDKEGGEKGKRYKIKEIHEDHFVIDEDIDGDDCFVFGYCVNDLHGLDKTYIYTLNVCATQELHRRIEAQKVIIQSQDERIISQDERIRELEEKMVDILKYLSL